VRQQVGSGNDIHDHLADARAATLVVPARAGRLSARRRGALAAATLTFTVLAGACARFHTGAIPDDWSVALASAQSRAASGEFATADSILAGYAMRHPGTHETLETAYWRAVFKLDPSNKDATMFDVMASLDAYLRDPRPRDHAIEAGTLRRTAARIDGLTRAAEAASAQAKDASSAAADAKAAAADAKADATKVDASASAAAADKDAEIRRLRDELAKANTELERIRKRLSTPPPTKPRTA
jgi:hypothetical protein